MAMPDREMVMNWLKELAEPDWKSFHSISEVQIVAQDALALLKEQKETINDLTDTIRQLNQHIKDLSEYMTPYGKLKDVKAYAELLKEQEAVKPYIDIDEAKCPICKVKLTRQELLGDDVLFEDFFDYCPHCGRSVKWE